ncbi:MAG: hypothetical protein ACLPWS_20545 [Rhodomicrobium sp.]
MQVRNECRTTFTEFDELFPISPQPLVPKRAAEILQSHMIESFEAALDQGMLPMDALASILSWVASEMARIRVEQAGGSR